MKKWQELRTEIIYHQSELQDLTHQLRIIQEDCKHPNLPRADKEGYDTENYKYVCPDCGYIHYIFV